MYFIFCLLLLTICYSFIGYPALLYVLSIFIGKKVLKRDREDLSVSIIISAYNEEDVIEAKIQNTLELDYPPDKLEIIVASDGSTDRTDEIVKRYNQKGVLLNRIEGRKGKTETQNETVRISKGDIIIFSDANAFYDRDAIRKLVRNFSDDSVGGVCGHLVYYKSKDVRDNPENTYWFFENFLKDKESSIGSVLGSNGSIYAIRANLYVPLDAYLISDLVEPLKVVEQGYRVIYEKEAISREEIDSFSDESHAFSRKVRINSRAILGLFNSLVLLNIKKHGFVSFELFSHKILRYIMPFLLIMLFFINIFLLKIPICLWLFLLQLVFLIMAFIGYIRRNSPSDIKCFSLPWYFVWTHAAVIVAWLKFLGGKKTIVWDTNRKVNLP